MLLKLIESLLASVSESQDEDYTVLIGELSYIAQPGP